MGRFTSDLARARFLDAYDRAFRLWPTPWREADIDTRFGSTHVHRYGSPQGEPIVLLHGAGGNASTWSPNVGALGEHHAVVALDLLGEPGRSVQSAPIARPDDAAAWLDEVLDGLELARAHLVGHSIGGWFALNQALRSPARVRSATLVDPAGFAKVGLRFYSWVVLSGFAALTPHPFHARAARLLSNPLLDASDLLPVILIGARTFRVRRVPPAPFTADELESVGTPVLLLLGARSPLHDSNRVRERVRALMPDVQVEIVPDTGHGPALQRPDLVNAAIIDFVDSRSHG